MSKKEKDKAAREAAAKYSSNLARAIVEYGKLSGQLTSTTDFKKLEDEMLSLLPPYRHPALNDIAECILFFDPDGLKFSASVSEIPRFVGILEKKGIADHLLTEIKKYVRESRRREIELAQCLELKQKLLDAKNIYADRTADIRIDKRNAEVVKKLGLSTRRGHASKFDSFKMWVDYVTLVRKKGMSPFKAVQEVRKKHGRKSKSATVETLIEQRASLLRKIEQRYPEMYDEATKCLTGIVPTRRYD